VKHTDILKQAWFITWRYRALWVFGFLLALCGGGGGGGGGNFGSSSGNFRAPVDGGDGGDFGELPNIPDIDPQLIWTLVIAFICLVLLLAIIGIVVRAVTRTALIRMVPQANSAKNVTVAEGWRMGWSDAAWRLFLVGLVIGIPVAILAIALIGLGLSPLLLLFTQEPALVVIGGLTTVFAIIFIIFLLIAVGAVVGLLQELAWRRTVLEERGVIESVTTAFALIKRRFKDVFIMWLLMLAISIGWAIVALLILFISFLVALIVGGLPALLVYLISESTIGAAVAGIPLALVVIILINSFASGIYLVFHSAAWTLAYLELQITPSEAPAEVPGDTPSSPVAAEL
jgi:hypothetical protein